LQLTYYSAKINTNMYWGVQLWRTACMPSWRL
jgi:hypothetical protein